MQKGKLTPLALALGFAATVNGFAAEVTGPHIQTSRAFDDDTIYTVTDNGSVIGSDDTNLVEITIAAGKTLTLKNTDDNWQTRILDGSNRGGLTFTGGNLVLRMDDTSTDSNSEQCFLRATNGDATTGTTTFNTDSAVVMEGSVPQGMTFHGDINFKNGFVMNIDRSAGDAARSITAVLGQLGGTLTTTSADINITAGKNDTSITGIEFGYGGNLNAASLNLQLNGSNAQSLKVVRGINIWDHKDYPQYNQYGKDITIAGPVTITLQDVPSASSYAVILTAKRDYSFAGPTKLTVNTSNRGYGLVTNRKVDFTDDLTMDFSGNNYSWGIFANAAGQVTAKTASINMQGGNSHAIWLKENASVAIAEALKTNAHYAMVGQGESTIDVQKNFITTARSGLSVQDKAKIFINSSGSGKVQFSGFTEMDDKSEGQIVLNVGSGSVDENSYWNVTDRSILTNLAVASKASLNFLLTADVLSSLADDEAIVLVTGTTPVLLHSAASASGASPITLSGTGLKLNAGDEVRLIKSSAGIALDKADNRLAAGSSLDELKGNLNVEHIASLSRVQETELTKDDYDLKMKSENMLVATIKAKRPSVDKVNDQTNALMQSSIASAATMYAADELLIDSTMKSRNGVRQTGPFAAARVGKYDLDVRGDLETNVISGLLGYAVNLQGSEIGAFVEMGHGTYDTKTAAASPLGKIRGDGKHNYVGLGVYGNYTTPWEWLHFTGYVKGGWLRNEFSAPIAGVSVDFDRTSNYWGAHLGMYGEFQAAGKIKNRTFLNYFYDGRESESYTASGSSDVAGADFHFNSLNSHRAQLGSVFEYAYTSALRPYAALTYEYAFKADAKGRASDQFGDLGLNGTDLEGSTGIVSLGWTYQNEAKRFEFDLGVNGYTGKRQGVSAQLQAAWKF
ncbi:autotransporter outer membrane beta-barrel domain-containing protein [Sutterella wadsworthensis]|uniref:autotransporter outer membrane beta-barrel domain-containing protein n=1 Tax=Sutterella wadsworthensis TaxID=40545 RepID=UPI0013F68F94|nr:autotransporter outer membrane beta-barrel domain-containing protein [Sutterella wadsworthensis]